MSTAYVVVTVLGAGLTAFSAGSLLLHAKWVVQPLADYGVPRSWWPWLGAAKVAGAVGSGYRPVGTGHRCRGRGRPGAVLHRGRHHGGPGALVLAHPVPTDLHGAGRCFLGIGFAK